MLIPSPTNSMCCSAWSASLSTAASCGPARCQNSRSAAHSGERRHGMSEHAQRAQQRRAQDRCQQRAGQAEHEQQRADVGDQQVLGHVREEQLVGQRTPAATSARRRSAPARRTSTTAASFRQGPALRGQAFSRGRSTGRRTRSRGRAAAGRAGRRRRSRASRRRLTGSPGGGSGRAWRFPFAPRYQLATPLPATRQAPGRTPAERQLTLINDDSPERRGPSPPSAGTYVPPAISTTPSSATTTPARWIPRTRSPSSAAASSTVVTGYRELATATVDSSPSVVETL